MTASISRPGLLQEIKQRLDADSPKQSPLEAKFKIKHVFWNIICKGQYVLMTGDPTPVVCLQAASWVSAKHQRLTRLTLSSLLFERESKITGKQNDEAIVFTPIIEDGVMWVLIRNGAGVLEEVQIKV